MSLWFSASAVAPLLKAEWGSSDSAATWLTLAVQLGFVVGTLASAVVNLPDVFAARRLVVVSALLGAAANAGARALRARSRRLGARPALSHRLLPRGRLPARDEDPRDVVPRAAAALALGVLIGALTVGKGFPYLVNAARQPPTGGRTSSSSRASRSLGARLVLLFVEEGPFAAPAARFDLAQVAKVFREPRRPPRGLRLLRPHVGALRDVDVDPRVPAREPLAAQVARRRLAEAASFLVIGSGAAGCVAAGLAADRVGRTLVTSVAMAVCGTCCVAIGFFYGAPPRSSSPSPRSGAPRSSPTRPSSRRASRSWRIPPTWGRR